MVDKPRVLIEDWLPVGTIGAESMRERGASSALPPLYFLHVWWARRPLTTSRAAILASLLPAFSKDWPKDLKKRFPDEKAYRAWFLKLIGILGDPVATRQKINKAKDEKINLGPNPYGYKRAFTKNPEPDEIEALHALLKVTWGDEEIAVLDSFAGGGSIPFEALRFGFTTYANELNSVASVILKATLDYPARTWPGFFEQLEKYGAMMASRVRERLEDFFPRQTGENIQAYIWARTVACPSTGKPVPLSPNWWLRQGDDAVVIRLIAEKKDPVCRFEIVEGKKAIEKADPDTGTVAGGVGRSPWTGDPIPGDYIKTEAQEGRMGDQLYAIAFKGPDGRAFRTPTRKDLDAAEAAEKAFKKVKQKWIAENVLPSEPFPETSTDLRPLHYGMPTWGDFFSPRQAITLGTYVETFHEVAKQIRKDLSKERAEAVLTYLGIAIDKAVDYNSFLVRYDGTRDKICNTFDRHDFSFKWSHAEFDGAHNLIQWTLGQVTDAFQGINKLAESDPLLNKGRKPATDRLTIKQGNAARLTGINDKSIHAVVVDPPYEANVMYAECSDFFYVWMKRTLGDIYPDWFSMELTNKDDEAVANEARFKDMGKGKKKQLALADYERKMFSAFKEMNRVLRDDGVLTVMFTHKKVEAWDTLSSALINAGFVVENSWPVHTESEHSLHQAKKNAAASTILLVCRKRAASAEEIWWDDLKGKVRQVAREKAKEFQTQGIRGVDLYISTFGPALSVISERWPVFTSQTDEKGKPIPMRPDLALDEARKEVIALRKQGLLGRAVKFDPVTDWAILAWDAFKAESFPADESRKLALALGLDPEEVLVRKRKVISKKGAFVVFLTPKERRGKNRVDAERRSFDCLYDAIHTALLVLAEDGAKACEAFLKAANLRKDDAFISALKALIEAVPRTRKKGKFIRPEAEMLEDLRANFFDEIAPPADIEVKIESPLKKSLPLFDGVIEEEESEDEESTEKE